MATQANTAVLGIKVVKRQLDKALRLFDEREQEINSQKTSLRTSITKEMKSLVDIIEEREKSLLGQLETLTEHKLQMLAAHKRKVELIRNKMSHVLLEASTQEQGKQQEISVEFDPSAIQPQTEADLVFFSEGVESIRQRWEEFGDVYSEQAAIENCTVSGEGLKFATTGKEAIVEAYNVRDRLNLTAELIHAKTESSIKCDVNQENDRHTITYQPVYRGGHSLHIRVNGRHIRGSPYPIAVTPSLESLCRPVRVVEGLSKPRGVATNSKGQLIVVEYESNYITIIAEDGRRVAFGGFGTEKGKFDKPRSVAVDKDDNIYVTDSGNHRVQKFTCEGKFIASVGSKGSEEGQFNLPLGLCFNNNKERLFVCDQLNYRVQVFSTSLTFKRTFGSEGCDDGQFNFPENIACDSSNHLYVTDYYNNRVQVLTSDGQFLRALTHKSHRQNSTSPRHLSSEHQLTHPRAIAVDSGGVVYVSEWERNGVNLFSAQGEFIGCGGDKGGERVARVCGLAVDQNDHLIVSRKNKLEII